MGEYEHKPIHDWLVWLDLETTGLDETCGAILELGLVLTDAELKEVDAVSWVVRPPDTFLDLRRMDPVVIEMHGRTGLLAECMRQSRHDHSINRIKDKAMSWLRRKLPKDSVGPGELTAAGFSVHFDTRWLNRCAPELGELFSHRVLDVSTMKVLCRRWHGERGHEVCKVAEEATHRVLADCREAIQCLRQIREWAWHPER